MTSNLFTDILGDEINDSQPISLPSSVSSGCEPLTRIMPSTSTCKVRPPKHTGQYGDFRSREEIDSKYRSVFTYPYFNLVQSRVIDDALYADKSMVVCAPTGSGKTVVFEMAIVQLLMELDDKKYKDDFKIIYMAPVKALCTERLTEWYPKFTKLGLLCIEVTGDTDVDFSQLKPYRIIITTPEKWDMLTRRWRDHKGLVEVIKLFLIDEVHILNDEVRGPVLEAVVSRMKTIESSVRSAQRIEQLQKQYRDKDTSTPRHKIPMSIRFVAVSATIGNPADVAAWLGSSEKPAVYYKFGDECRPVKLKRIVEGYPCSEGTSIFKFDIILNYKLWPIIQRYHNGKPTLIFCNTRKSVILTAETLSREITVGFNPEQKAKLTALASMIKTKKLQTLVLNGVGCHHAGLLYEERMTIEQAFRNRDLPILITTTTLAMGVNLPAHLVIIKNTQQYVNGAYQEYSISTVLQMVGRAGRPQFDTEATAVIMTRLGDKPRYQALVGGSEPLQSYLHKRIPENLNSEAALGTISDVAQCVQWLRSTFLSVRAASDPKLYLGLTPSAPAQLITKKLEELCVKAMNGLATAGLITMDEACCIESTEAGRLMSIFYLDLETMKLIMKVDGSESLERLLWLVCQSHELADMHLRTDERRCLNTLNRNSAAATIRYPMKGKISSREMKLNCVIQAILGCLPIPDPSLNQEAMKIMRIAERVCKCLVTYITRPDLVNQHQKTFAAVTNCIILAKCITAHLWENSQYVSKQLKGIGPTFSTLLASAGKVNFMLLEESHPRDLERIMNKGPPAGNVLRKQISLLPKYQLTMTPVDEKQVTVEVALVNQAYLSENTDNLTAGDNHKSYLIVGDSENYLLLLQSFKDKDLISLYDGKLTYQVTRKHNFEHKILVHCISSTYVGIDVQTEYTFKDIQPQFIRREVYREPYEDITDKNTKQTTKRQTNITDTFKERKRRNNNDEITQSKEKKRRDSALIEKFRVLKESFGVTTNEIKNSLQESTNATNKILQNLVRPNSCDSSNNIIRTPVLEHDFKKSSEMMDIVDLDFDDTFTDEVNYGNTDLMDDSRINNILSEIESEISNKNVNFIDSAKPSTSKNEIFNQNKLPALQQQIKNEKSLNIAPATNRYLCKTLPRKKSIKKSNYTFIDKIENRMDDDDIPESTQAEKGFSDGIKFQIATFLNRSMNKTPCVDLNIQGLLRENNDNGPKNSLTSLSEGKRVTSNDNSHIIDDRNKQKKSNDTMLTIELDQHPTIEKISQLKDKDFIDENTVEENISCSNETVKLEDLENIHDIHSEIESFKKSLTIVELETEPTKNHIETWMETNNSKNSSTQKEYINSLDVSTDTVSTIISINDRNIHETPKTELIPCHVGVVANIEDNTKSLNPLPIQNWHVKNSTCTTEALVHKQPVNFMKASDYIKLKELTKYGTAHSNPPINDITEVTDSVPSKQSILNGSTYCYKSNYATNVSPATGYVHKYSFSATKIDMCTKQIPDQRIHVIRKMKVDVDVTEIVTPARNNYRENDIGESSASNKHEGACNIETESKKNETKSIELPNLLIESTIYDGEPEKIEHGIIKENYDTSNEFESKFIQQNLKMVCDPKSNDESENSVTSESAKQIPKETKDKPVTDIIQPDDKENKPCTVKDILSKYLNKLGKSKATSEISNFSNTSLNRISEIKPDKPKRPYKICDIDKHNVTLPKTLIPEAPKFHFKSQETVQNNDESNYKNTVWESAPANRKEYNMRNPNELKDPSDYKLNNSLNKIECISPEPVFNVEECPVSPAAESMLDQSMFNPKTLLQCLNNDQFEEEIIPPPPQFCDLNSEKNHSPFHYLSTNYSYDTDNKANETFLTEYDASHDDENTDDYNINNTNSEFEYDTSIFENDSKIKLTPTKEIETWTFTNDDASMDHATRGAHLLENDLNKSWTIMHKNSPQVSVGRHSFTPRQSRLGQFKFSHKRNYTIVKRDKLN